MQRDALFQVCLDHRLHPFYRLNVFVDFHAFALYP
jgi:hypothetical protein